ncbi:MAG: type II toxin-antitoxin system CcdA family antitoxin [Geothrix sp.]|jgi:antitoxin CcdA|uniref:Type II toxin-antitoxin system CcdA family antitoxin n=1 Tax=Candidatus Geothrix odensensis TaxID=2954440 RepID=A0A936F1A9_9BACT|nr:type II toxin-antitoxin system CcdA family antitoxin [Candidatus Geothrix odensensis]MBP7618638.1 type II toxin-antitoxin system CcdA family antitoxin [Geothrix sp.]MCC6513769.1 type II toxin-antitoxin system CcdA family antitoxin [Geothrix sp.]
MRACYKTDAPKKPVNLSLNGDLLKVSKDLGLNLSGLAEEAIAKAVRARLAEVWLSENAEAILAYNKRVESQGVFSDGLRNF